MPNKKKPHAAKKKGGEDGDKADGKKPKKVELPPPVFALPYRLYIGSI